MSALQLTAEAMALPLAERVSLAQALWQSINTGMSVSNEQQAIQEAICRDEELSSGTVTGRSHAEAMQAARRAIQCS